jgi:LCP family protein required for cell wall assembly
MAKPRKQKRKMPLALKFILIVFSIVFTFIVAAGVGVMAYISNNTFVPLTVPPVIEDIIDASPRPRGITFLNAVPKYTNFVMVGLDDEGDGHSRTDTIMMGTFNSQTNDLSVISIPRDMPVSIPDDVVRQLNHAGRYPPSYMKFNEVYVYAGKDYGMYTLIKTVESEFGIKIDHYLKIDLDAFVEIVDALGGVEMTLTRNYNYRDPDQNLTISLRAGHQLLMGKDALGLVRYRWSYRDGDLGRIRVQQQFMNELFRQTLNRDTVMKNLPGILQVVIRNVETDMSVAQATRYLKHVAQFKPDNLQTYTIPTGEGFRDAQGKAYVRMDRAGAEEIIDEVFRGIVDEPPENSMELPLSVLNGSGVSGIARQTKENLEELGYRVTSIGDFTGTRTKHDRIFVKKRGFAEDLKLIFNNAEIIVDKSMVSPGAEITVVLGTDHKDE